MTDPTNRNLATSLSNDRATNTERAPFPLPNIATNLLQPPSYSITGLDHPVLVKISVDTPQREYAVPQALITGQSAYFRKAFEGGFKEGQEKHVKLPGVKYPLFEILVGWLYTGRVFREAPRDMVADAASPVPGSMGGAVSPGLDGQSGHNGGGRKRLGGGVVDGEEHGQAKRVKLDPLLQDVGETSPVTEQGPLREVQSTPTQSQSPIPRKPEGVQTSAPKPQPGYDRKYAVSWPWRTLFALYVFADAHDTRGFRNAIMNIIQIKMLQRHPHTIASPSAQDFAYALHRLPSSSPLHRFLIHTLTHHTAASRDIAGWAELPPEALAEVFLNQKHITAFLECAKCRGTRPLLDLDCRCVLQEHCVKCNGFRCFAEEHAGLFTDVPPYYQSMCLYHEHATLEEKRVCVERWEAVDRERDIWD